MYVRLNLATQPLVSHRRFLVGSTLLGFVGSVLLVFLAWHFHTLRKTDADFRARTGKIQLEMSRLMEQRNDLEHFYAREENRSLQERSKFIGGVIQSSSFNWTKMFMDLEKTLPTGVHILRIEPKLESGSGSVTVRFLVAGASQESEVELLKAFEDSRSFTHIELSDVGANKQGSPGSTDVFTVEFSAIYTGI
jgi:Tfp pilus assembly protein PilN